MSRKLLRPRKIVSGGQTGVDRGALDAAIELNIEHGGRCPRGRLAEDGAIPARYRLEETQLPLYRVRTEQNVLESDATLILFQGPLAGGTRLTAQLVRRHRKPYRIVDLDAPSPAEEIRDWLAEHKVEVLNVAGPRESQRPGIGVQAKKFVKSLFAPCARRRK